MTASASCSSPQPLLLGWLASAAAVAAAVLLWGVGAEAVHFGHRLSGGLLLADAVIVTALEAATIGCLAMQTRGCSCRRCSCCGPIEWLAAGVDSYRRAAVYSLLTVPCFVQLHRYWLPAVPGSALILATLLYAAKHCCGRKAPHDFGKMPTFVRFDEDGCPAPEADPPTAACNIYQPAWSISVESPVQEPQVRDDVTAQSPPPPPPRRHQRARRVPPAQPDKRCLISEVDSISLCD